VSEANEYLDHLRGSLTEKVKTELDKEKYQKAVNQLQAGVQLVLLSFGFWLVLNFYSFLFLSRNRKAGSFCVPLTSEQCTFGTRCAWRFRCVPSWQNPHPWLREPGDQGSCNSCWAFAAVHTVNDRLIRNHGSDWQGIKLSVQNILDCAYDGDKDRNPCISGTTMQALKTLEKYGAHEEYQTPYLGFPSGKCITALKPRYRVKHIGAISNNTEESMINHLDQHGPFIATFEIFDNFIPFFRWNPLGLYHSVNGAVSLGSYHAAEIVGYGVQHGVKYWLAKNSWGNRWGDKGYFKIKRGSNFCNIEDFTIGPTVAVAFSPIQSYSIQPDSVRKVLQERIASVSAIQYSNLGTEYLQTAKIQKKKPDAANDAVEALLHHLDQNKRCHYYVSKVLFLKIMVVAGFRVNVLLDIQSKNQQVPRDCPLGYFEGEVWLKLNKKEYRGPSASSDVVLYRSNCDVGVDSCSFRFQILSSGWLEAEPSIAPTSDLISLSCSFLAAALGSIYHYAYRLGNTQPKKTKRRRRNDSKRK